MFLGVLIEDMNLGNLGWGLMLGWTIWVVLIPLILEIINLKYRSGERKLNNYLISKFSINILLRSICR